MATEEGKPGREGGRLDQYLTFSARKPAEMGIVIWLGRLGVKSGGEGSKKGVHLEFETCTRGKVSWGGERHKRGVPWTRD